MILTPTDADLSMVLYMAKNARPEDRREWFAGTFMRLDAALAAGLGIPGSVNRAILDEEGNPLVIYGAHPTQAEGLGQAWLIATPEALHHVYSLHHFMNDEVRTIEAPFKTLVAYSHPENRVHHKWMHWMGFRRIGRLNSHIPFLTFVKGAERCAFPRQ